MKVVCRINNLNNIANTHVLERLKKYLSKPDGEIDLDIGREYKVYGVVFWDNCPWYYIFPEDYDEYPKPFSAEFFDMVDDKLSPHWKLSSFSQGEYESSTSLVFDEWAKDPSFYESLIEGDSEAVYTFTRYRNMIDKE
jgi:hypothetical protein